MLMNRITERLRSVPVKKKAKQLMAVTLSVILVNPFTAYGAFVHAKEVETITAFTELSDEIANQQLAVGAVESDIQLPDTLNVAVESASVDQSGSNAQTTSGPAINVDTVQDATETTQSVTLENITWEMNSDNSTSASFDSSVEGAFYSYVPVLPEGYILATNISLPEISVQIGSGLMKLMTSESSITISGVSVDSTDWYATTDTSGTVNTAGASADNWNVHVVISDTTATVTLKNATIKNSSADASAITVNGYDLNIVLEGTANQIGTDATSEGYAIYKKNSGNVTIIGVGDLTVKGNYGVLVNGVGDVDIDITGSLSIESRWQMIYTSGAFTVEAGSIDMNGSFIYCNGSVSLTATTGDVALTGNDNYAIQAGNITVSAPQGGINVSGEYNSLYGGDNTTITVSAKNDVTLKGIVYSGSVSISSGNGNINLNSDYQVIQGASKDVALSAPQGDITLRTTNKYVNIIDGSGYGLTILACGTLAVQSANGIAGYSMADIKAQSVKIAATGEGYGLSGGTLSITNPEGGNCSKVYINGGGGGREAILASNLTIKADQVTIAAEATASNAVYVTGDAKIDDAGIIVGAISVKGMNNISMGIVQVSSNGGDVSSSGLDLKSTTPTQTTYYKAGEGYILYTPAQGGNNAVLALMNATIETDAEEALILPDAAVKLQLSGRNKLYSNAVYGGGITGNDSLTITSLDGGTLDMESIHYTMNFEKAAGGSTITIGGNASVTAVSLNNIAVITQGNLSVEADATFSAKGEGIDVIVDGGFHASEFKGSVLDKNDTTDPKTYDITIYGTCDMPVLLAAVAIGTLSQGVFSLHIPSGSQLTIPTNLQLIITDMSRLKLEGKIVNNGILYLPVGTTADQIKAMNLTGTGGVFVTKSIDGNGMPSKENGDAYTNDGNPLNLVGEEVNLDITKEITASENAGYTWTKSGEGESEVWTLNLSSSLIRGNVSLPDNKAITINCTQDTVIDGIIFAGQGYKCNLTFTGSGKLSIGNGISNGIGGIVTVKDGARIITGRLSFGGSGNSDSVLNIIGKDSSLTATSNQGSAVSVETVNVTDGGQLITNAETVGVKAGKGGVSITGGSTLTAGCDYGVYIIGGKLTMDESSKLITNGSIAPFCIVDTTSTKEQSAVLSLAGVPTGTEIASVKGTDTGYGYTYWSLVKEGGNLQALNENSEPVTLTGAVQGEKLDFSRPTPPAPSYSVSVQTEGNGTASASVTLAKQGTEITLTATPSSNYKFKGWQVISGGVTVIDNKFIMQGNDVTVKAMFEAVSTDNNGGNSGGNDGGNDNGNNGGSNGSSGNTSSDDSSGSTTTPEKNSDQPVIASVKAVGTVTAGHAVVRITDSMVKTAIEKAQSDAKAKGKTANGIGVEVSVTAPGAKSFTVITERAALNRLVSTNVKLLQVTGLQIYYSFDQLALKQQVKKGTGDVAIKVKPATVKGVRSAYDITLSTKKNGKTVKITSLGKGKATLSLPYAPAKKEAVDGLYAVYVNVKGKVTRIAGSAYNTESKSVIFTTNRISVYGVGYTAPTVK